MEPQRLRATLARARSGDEDAFSELMDAYARRLYGYFFRATRSHHDAEDLLGETALRLVRTLGSYDERGRFEPWLFRIAANLVRDRIRRRSAAPGEVSLSAGDGERTSPGDRLAAGDDPADAGLLRGEASDALNRAMEKLDATTRQMILLRHFGGMSFRELAETFAVPMGTALAKVHRGLGKLRKLMENDDGTG